MTRDLDEARDAIHAFVDKYTLCEPELNHVTSMAWFHGNRYEGPSFEKELNELKRIASKYPKTPD